VATWAVRLAPAEPISSLVQLFAGADWREREQFDLVGVVFADHPDLRRLMMPENYDRHPSGTTCRRISLRALEMTASKVQITRRVDPTFSIDRYDPEGS
jgi:Ni,Fe-hydrogenase III component G